MHNVKFNCMIINENNFLTFLFGVEVVCLREIFKNQL